MPQIVQALENPALNRVVFGNGKNQVSLEQLLELLAARGKQLVRFFDSVTLPSFGNIRLSAEKKVQGDTLRTRDYDTVYHNISVDRPRVDVGTGLLGINTQGIFHHDQNWGFTRKGQWVYVELFVRSHSRWLRQMRNYEKAERVRIAVKTLPELVKAVAAFTKNSEPYTCALIWKALEDEMNSIRWSMQDRFNQLTKLCDQLGSDSWALERWSANLPKQ